MGYFSSSNIKEIRLLNLGSFHFFNRLIQNKKIWKGKEKLVEWKNLQLSGHKIQTDTYTLDILWCEVADQIGRQKMACKFQQNLEWFLKTSSFDISGIGMKTDSSHTWPSKGHPKKPNTRRKGMVAFGCVTTPPPNSKDFSFFPFFILFQ